MSTTEAPLVELADQRQKDYLAASEEMRRSIYWRFDPDREVWQFDPDDTPVPPAPDWFFIVNHPRTGSTVTVRLLNAHPEIYCGMEHHALPLFMSLLGSRFFMSPELAHAVRYLKRIEITPTHMRYLMDAWRRCLSPRPIFGDKGEMYFSHFGAACEQVFPGCKFLLTVRHPLDTLSSFIRQFWTAYLYDVHQDADAFHADLRRRACEMLATNRTWSTKARVIEFEALGTRERFVEIFRGVFEALGADPEAFDWEAGWRECAHCKAIGRWREDPRIVAFLEWLERRDPRLRELLLEGCYYLPDGVEAPLTWG